ASLIRRDTMMSSGRSPFVCFRPAMDLIDPGGGKMPRRTWRSGPVAPRRHFAAPAPLVQRAAQPVFVWPIAQMGNDHIRELKRAFVAHGTFADAGCERGATGARRLGPDAHVRDAPGGVNPEIHIPAEIVTTRRIGGDGRNAPSAFIQGGAALRGRGKNSERG